MKKNQPTTPALFSGPGVRARLATPTGKRQALLGGLAAVVMIGAIFLANYVTTDYGFIPVGFGLSATAGTIFAGFALAARDAIQDTWGRLAIGVIIIIGTLISLVNSAPEIAAASALAFLISETMNFAVYTPLRTKSKLGDRRWATAVVTSNIAGAVGDTVVFLGVAFGAAAILPALPGQLVGKMYATLLYLVIGRIAATVVARSRAARTPATVRA